MRAESVDNKYSTPIKNDNETILNAELKTSQFGPDNKGNDAAEMNNNDTDNVEVLNFNNSGKYYGFLKVVKSFPWESIVIGSLAILGALIAWQILSYYKVSMIISFENIPTPIVVGEQFLKLIVTEEFYKHIGASLQRIAIAFSMASVLGITIGIFMGRSRIFSGIMMPYIEILRPIPAVAWIPLAILMLPTEESSIIYITFLGAFFPVVLNTVHGVEQTSGSLVRAAESLGASKFMIMWHVTLPGALPSIMAGLAIGMGVAWFSLLAGEIISGQYGIGYFTWNSYTLIEYPNIIIGMLTIGGLGTLSTWLVKKASVPALRWQEHKD